MKISRTFIGFCPTLEKDYQIVVDYTDARTNDNPYKYIQGLTKCMHQRLNGCPIESTCPIKAKAPNEIASSR
ncbi:MAG: hypothetical protein APF81_27490 [Desulfosporosinus sp. BRH_c37]|nr:MAG: hypothetical protein APF81_27490 [Desulfosporosinus sp. BRH_c37]